MVPDVRDPRSRAVWRIMTITESPPPTTRRPTPARHHQRSFVERAAASAPVLERHAADTTATAPGCTTRSSTSATPACWPLGVPIELGGDGATISDVAAIQRELAKSCGSTALASAMHQHVTAFTAWRYRRNLPGAEATLRRIAEDGIVVVSTGGGDYTHPRGTAVKVDGGYRVSGRKSFVSQSPVGAVLSTMFVYDDPDRACAC